MRPRGFGRGLLFSCFSLVLAAGLFALTACGDDDIELVGDGGNDEPEVFTTVELTFSPAGGGDSLVFEFDDPDGDGGALPTSDDVMLDDGVTYELSVRFFNKLASWSSSTVGATDAS